MTPIDNFHRVLATVQVCPWTVVYSIKVGNSLQVLTWSPDRDNNAIRYVLTLDRIAGLQNSTSLQQEWRRVILGDLYIFQQIARFSGSFNLHHEYVCLCDVCLIFWMNWFKEYITNIIGMWVEVIYPALEIQIHKLTLYIWKFLQTSDQLGWERIINY